MKPEFLDSVIKPTLLLDEDKARHNLHRMAHKAAEQRVRFRPHFKTHQSATIGSWCREFGVDAITVSSLDMAAYFARHGWQDILVAFPVNLREIKTIQELAGRLRLGLLVESLVSVEFLRAHLNTHVDLYIEIDTGMHRAGLEVSDVTGVRKMVESIGSNSNLRLRGLLTHAGQTYHAGSPQEATQMYADSCAALGRLRDQLASFGINGLEISVGDTPGCWLSEHLGDVDEIRPGNFLFFDAMMADLGVCSLDEVAVAVACPLVALYPHRKEALIYGGGVHLSKEMLIHEGQPCYGYLALHSDTGWRPLARANHVRSLSQEHGILCLEPEVFSQFKVGDIALVLPVHSCLAVDALGSYQTLDGQRISTRLGK